MMSSSQHDTIPKFPVDSQLISVELSESYQLRRSPEKWVWASARKRVWQPQMRQAKRSTCPTNRWIKPFSVSSRKPPQIRPHRMGWGLLPQSSAKPHTAVHSANQGFYLYISQFTVEPYFPAIRCAPAGSSGCRSAAVCPSPAPGRRPRPQASPAPAATNIKRGEPQFLDPLLCSVLQHTYSSLFI